MSEPKKPFACVIPDCDMTFTNEDHLNVHTKKHDMVLQLALGQKGVVFVADQTPTPTRFIRNCEEVGLFQDLNVNPFDETFKRAMETSLEANGPGQGDDVLHTPHIFPHLSEDSLTVTYTSSNHKSSETTDASSTAETIKDKNSQTSVNGIPAKTVYTVTTAQKHNLAVQKGLLTHCVDASLHLPVISISESDDSSERLNPMKVRYAYPYSAKVIKNDILLACPSKSNLESLHPPTPEDRAVPLISQKSIEQALDNLTRESKEQHQQEESLPAEKCDELTIQKVAIPKINILENRSGKLVKVTSIRRNVGNIKLKRQNSEVIDKLKESHDKKLNQDTGTQTRPKTWIEEDTRRDSLANGEGAINGYELFLKLPNGKKVFLKEASKSACPQDLDKEKKKCTRDALKDMIGKNKFRKAAVRQNSVFKQDKLPMPANPLHFFTFPNNFKYVQGMLATETTARAQVIAVVNPTMDSKAVKKAAKAGESKKEAKPKKLVTENVNKMDTKEMERRDGESPPRETVNKSNPAKIVQAKEKLAAGAAAGRRYRRRKEEAYKTLIEENHKLQLKNDSMSAQLVAAMVEIKRLRNLVSVHHSSV